MASSSADRKQIFISMGTPYTEEQTAFRSALVSLINEQQMDARIINVTDYPTGNPLTKIKEVLSECDGAIVVAYERTYFDVGLEKRLSASLRKPLGQTRYTTAWNQVEAAIGYALSIPIFVLMENDLQSEGLLEDKYDWYIEKLDIASAALERGDSRARLCQWCRDVKARKPLRPSLDAIDANTTMGDVLRALPVKILVQIVTWLVGLLVVAFGLGVTLSRLPIFHK